MDDKSKSGKAPVSAAERRQLRLEQELRANLQKRKAQARARREDLDGDKPVGEAPTPLPPRSRSD